MYYSRGVRTMLVRKRKKSLESRMPYVYVSIREQISGNLFGKLLFGGAILSGRQLFSLAIG